jgi:signal transduction histidine kinase/ActR/RegA family two-component response regulator
VGHFFNAPVGSWHADPSIFVPAMLGTAVVALVVAGYAIVRSQRRIGQVRAEEQELLRNNRQLHFLNAISKVAAQSFDVEEILQNSVEQLLGLFSADTGAVWLMEADGRTVRRRAYTGALRPELNQLEVPDDFVALLQQQKLEFFSERDLAKVPRVIMQLVEVQNVQSMMCVLLWAAEEPMGALVVGSFRKDVFDENDRALLLALGRQLATTLERVRLFHNTRHAYDHLQLTQEQLLQSEKLRAMGQLVSGVAHELNNPLTAVVGYAELLQGEELQDTQRDYVGKMLKQALRMQRLVQNLLAFARQRKPEKAYVDLRTVAEDALALRDFDIKRHGIAVETSFAKDVPHTFGDTQQLEQVFLNIINNAIDAVLEVGCSRRLQVKVMQEEGRLCAEVRDFGPGLKEPNKVFDPFYTTKPVGRGTGLGLSICYGIVKEHNGELRAFNHPEGGAVFRVYLQPVAAPTEAAPTKKKEVTAPQLVGRILVVDDEASVLDFEREVLTRSGAQVVALSSGDEALSRLELEKFDAVVLDTSMPGRWSGPDIYRWIASNRPGAERNIVLACSDITEAGVRSLIEGKRVPCLTKPFQAQDLVEVLQSVISQQRSNPKS